MIRTRSLFRAVRCKPARPMSRRLSFTSLEDRVTPAHNITILPGGSLTIPAGATAFTDTADYTIDPAALSGGGALRANNDITVSDSHALHQWTAQARIGYAF